VLDGDGLDAEVVQRLRVRDLGGRDREQQDGAGLAGLDGYGDFGRATGGEGRMLGERVESSLSAWLGSRITWS
jgi:hypothetical protein